MTEIATAQIRDAILKGVYKPGTKIIPALLEKDLALGKSPIRDAIRELVGIGLLVNNPNKGTVVSEPITKNEIIEVFEIRYMLEGQATFNATQTIGPEGIEQLEAINDKIQQLDRSSPSVDFFKINKNFHKTLYQFSNRPFLLRLVEQIWDQIMLFRIVYPYASEALDICTHDHNQIIKAVKAKNPQLAQRRLVAHLKKGLTNLVMQMQIKGC